MRNTHENNKWIKEDDKGQGENGWREGKGSETIQEMFSQSWLKGNRRFTIWWWTELAYCRGSIYQTFKALECSNGVLCICRNNPHAWFTETTKKKKKLQGMMCTNPDWCVALIKRHCCIGYATRAPSSCFTTGLSSQVPFLYLCITGMIRSRPETNSKPKDF